MNEIKFNCPSYLAQRFWKHCVDKRDTPGAVLRAYMINEVQKIFPDYKVETSAATTSSSWSVVAVETPNDPTTQ